MTMHRWKPADTAPKDGSHIMVAFGPYGRGWGFNQRPPAVVHYWPHHGEEGFYLSAGSQLDDPPVVFTEWCDLGLPPGLEEACDRTDRILREQEG